VAVIWRVLSQSESAGFGSTGVKWYQYALTEARAIFTYLRLTVLPYGQSIDHDFPVSHTPFEHGAIVYVVLLASVAVLAWFVRRRWPLASFGLLLFLVLLAPTSSVIPIADPLVERRMYLPLAGLILVGCEAAGRLRMTQAAAGGLAAMLAVLAVVTFERNTLWGHPEEMWIAAAMQSTHKSRPYLHLSEMLVAQKRCPEAISYLERAEKLMPDDGMVQVGFAKALDCLDRRDEALARLQRAAAVKPSTGVYQWLGLLEGAMDRSAEAGAALKKAVELGPRNSDAHSALALWYESVGNRKAAIEEYQKTMSLNQYNAEARAGLMRLTGKSR
jgi:protein O-mannosyl-transferase